MRYDVMFCQQIVGTAEMTAEGLYYKICCKCKLADGIYRLTDSCEKGKVLLGVLQPLGNMYGIEKRIPVKTLGKGAHFFEVITCAQKRTVFAPIRTYNEFSYLEGLEKARFHIENGCPGLLIEID